jgi:hypothetical protein
MTGPAAYYLQPLSWRQTSARPESYELRAIPGPLASLTFRSRSEAVVEAAAASWRFRTKGLLQRLIEIRSLPAEALVASCRRGYWSSTGIVQLSSGLTLVLAASSWDKTYSVRTDRGALVLSYDFRGYFALHAPLTWGEHPGPAGQHAWLVPFAWFMAVRHYREVIEAAGAVVISG